MELWIRFWTLMEHSAAQKTQIATVATIGACHLQTLTHAMSQLINARRAIPIWLYLTTQLTPVRGLFQATHDMASNFRPFHLTKQTELCLQVSSTVQLVIFPRKETFSTSVSSIRAKSNKCSINRLIYPQLKIRCLKRTPLRHGTTSSSTQAAISSLVTDNNNFKKPLESL